MAEIDDWEEYLKNPIKDWASVEANEPINCNKLDDKISVKPVPVQPTIQSTVQPQPTAEEMLREQVFKYLNIISTSNRLKIDFVPLPGFFEEMIEPGVKLIVRRYTPNPKDRNLFNLISTQGTVSSIDIAAGTITIDFETKSGIKTLTYKYKDLITAITGELPESTTDKSYIHRALRIDEIQIAEMPNPTAPSSLSPSQIKVRDSLQVGNPIKVARYVPASRDSADVKLVKSDGKLVSKNDTSFTAEFTLPTGKTMNLTFQYSAVVDNSVKLPQISPVKNDQFNKVQILRTTGGNEMTDPYYLKYLKYKAKYLKLKESN